MSADPTNPTIGTIVLTEDGRLGVVSAVARPTDPDRGWLDIVITIGTLDVHLQATDELQVVGQIKPHQRSLYYGAISAAKTGGAA